MEQKKVKAKMCCFNCGKETSPNNLTDVVVMFERKETTVDYCVDCNSKREEEGE